MISYKRDVLERQSLSEVKMGRGSPICERVRKKIVEYLKKKKKKKKKRSSMSNCKGFANLSVVWKQLQSRLQSLAKSCTLSWAHLRVCSPLSAGHLPQTLQKQSCQNHQGLNHPDNCLFTLLPSGKRFRCLMAKTERLRRSFFPKAIRLLNSNSAS